MTTVEIEDEGVFSGVLHFDSKFCKQYFFICCCIGVSNRWVMSKTLACLVLHFVLLDKVQYSVPFGDYIGPKKITEKSSLSVK